MTSTADLALALKLKDEGFGRGIDDANKKLGGLAGAATAPVRALGGLASGLGSVAEIAGGVALGGGLSALPGKLFEFVGAAQADEQAAARVSATLRTLGGDFAAQAAAVDDAIAAGQRLAFSDDDVRDGFNKLALATGDSEEALKRLQLAEDLARGANIPLSDASKLLGKVTDENLQVFKKMGITLPDVANEADVLAAVQKKFAGQSKAYADSTAGQFEQAKIALAETGESIGYMVLPAVTKMAQGLADVIPKVQDFVGKLSAGISDLIGPALDRLSDTVRKVFEGDLKGAFDDFVAFVREIGPKLVAQLSQWAQAFVDWIGPLVPPMLAALLDLWTKLETWLLGTALPWLVESLAKWAAAFLDWIGPQIEPMLRELGHMLERLGTWIVESAPGVLAKLGEWGLAFVNWVGPRIKPMLEELGKLALEILGWIKDRGVELGTKLVTEWIPAFLNWVATDLVPKIPPTFEALKTAIWNWITNDAVPWVAANAPVLGSAMVDAIKAGFSALGGVLKNVWEAIDWTAGPVRFTGKNGFEWIGPSLTIPMPNFGGGQQGPTLRGGAGGANTIAQTMAALVADGLDPNKVALEVKNICGPIAAEGILRGLGMAVNIGDVEAKAKAIGAYVPGAGFNGPWMMQALLGQYGISSNVTTDLAAAQRAAAAGVPIGISTPGHWYMADMFANGRFDVGNSGLAVGGSASMTFEQIKALGDGFQQFVIPNLQRGADATELLDQVLTDLGLDARALPDSLGEATNAATDLSDAIAYYGELDPLWGEMQRNAANTGRALDVYMRDIGALAVDTSTASLEDLRHMSGLTWPQIQEGAAAAAEDERHWLLTVAVPAARALMEQLGLTGTAATEAATNIKLTAVAGATLGNTLEAAATPKLNAFMEALAKVPERAKAASQAWSDMVSAMDRNQASSGPGGSNRQQASENADIGVHEALDSRGATYIISKPYSRMTEQEKDDANRFGRAYPNGQTFDSGGWLMPGWTLAYNGTGRPERVSTAGGSDGSVYVTVQGSVLSERQLVDAVHEGLLRKQRATGSLGLH